MPKIILWCVGASVGYIISKAISFPSKSLELVVMAVSISVSGSVFTEIGKLIFLKAEIESQRSGGFVKVFLRTMFLAIVIFAAIILAHDVGIIR
jgi:hypothetical protein